MKTFLHCLLFLICGIGALGAQSKADSLRQLILNSPEDPVRLEALLELTEYLRLRKQDSTLVYAAQAEELAQQLGDQESELRALTARGLFLHNHGNVEAAKLTFLAAQKRAKEQQIAGMIPVLDNNLALVYRRAGQRDSAYYYWSQAEKGYEAVGLPYECWRVYLGMGQLFWEREDLENAELYLKKAYDITSTGQNPVDQGYLLFQLGDYYFSTENFDQLREIRSIWDQRQSVRRTSKELMELPEHTSLLYLFGQVKPDIIPRLQKAAAYFREQEDHFNEAWIIENLGLMYTRAGNNQQAIEILQRALGLFTRYNAKVRIGAVQYALYQVYKDQGNEPQALAVLEDYTQLKDSLRSAEIEGNLAKLQVQYETEKKEQALRIQELELSQKTQERNILLASTILLALLAVSIFLSYRQRLRTNHQLNAQAAEIQAQKIRQLEQDNQLLSLNSMIEGQESERMRIAQDLHDGIGGLLTSVKAHFYAIQEQVEKLQKLNIYQKTNELIDEACIEVRRISQNMMPRALQLLGLKGAIEDLATQLRQKDLDCELEIIGLQEEPDRTRANMIFRIVQELCNNISKHAGATKVFIQLLQHGNELSLIVEDDGKGFDLNQASGRSASLGLKNIESRVRFLEGSWDIDSVPGEGTTVMIRIPLS